jgi:hypothetical protein
VADQLLAGLFGLHTQGHAVVVAQAKTQQVRVRLAVIRGKQQPWWGVQLHHDLQRGGGQCLARPDVKRHTSPPPRVNLQP